MKNVSLALNVILLGALTWIWMSSHAPRKSQQAGQSLPVEASAPPEGLCTQNPDNGSFTFNGQDAISMVSEYTRDHWQDINLSGNFPPKPNVKDSRCVWFSLSRLKGFIHEIEKQAGNMKDKCCDTLGIRIYFAEYNKEVLTRFNLPTQGKPQGWFNSDYSYNHKTTVLMVPTIKMNDGKHHDFNPLYSNVCNFRDTATDMWNGPILALMMDHGSIIPPPFPSKYAVAGPGNYIYKYCGADFLVFGVDAVNNAAAPHPNPYYNQSTVPGGSGGNWFDL